MVKSLVVNAFWDHAARVYDDALRGVNWTEKQAAIAEGVSQPVLEACYGSNGTTCGTFSRISE